MNNNIVVLATLAGDGTTVTTNTVTLLAVPEVSEAAAPVALITDGPTPVVNISEAPTPGCGFCLHNGGSSLSVQNVVNTTSPASVLFYTDYTLTLVTPTQGTCLKTAPLLFSLATPFSYTLSGDSNNAIASAQDSFADYLVLKRCGFAQRGVVTTSSSVAVSRTTGAETSSSPLPSSARSTPLPVSTRTTQHRGLVPLTSNLKIMIGIVVPISVLVFTLSVFGIIRRNAKLRKLKEAQNRENQAQGEDLPGGEDGNTPPFLQRKPELHGEDSRHEVHGLDVRHELPGSVDRQEAPGEESALEAPGEHAIAEVERPP